VTKGLQAAELREFLNSSELRLETTEARRAGRQLADSPRPDYSAALRSHFSHRELRELIGELCSRLPGLNREVFRETDLRNLAAIAAGLGATFHAEAFHGREGSTLRGFYVKDPAFFRRALICVNVEGHRIGVSAAFWHELGHHLAGEIFGGDGGRRNLTLGSNYQGHLSDAEEVIADTTMVLAAYPKVAAQRLFGGRRRMTAKPHLDGLLSKALGHLRSVSGFEFPAHVAQYNRRHILAGMVHAARLRQALLWEYGV
jgi:hypothetical protein